MSRVDVYLRVRRVVMVEGKRQVHADVTLCQVLRDGVVHPFHPVPGVASGMARADAIFRVALGVVGPELPSELTNLAQAGAFLRDGPYPPVPLQGPLYDLEDGHHGRRADPNYAHAHREEGERLGGVLVQPAYGGEVRFLEPLATQITLCA